MDSHHQKRFIGNEENYNGSISYLILEAFGVIVLITLLSLIPFYCTIFRKCRTCFRKKLYHSTQESASPQSSQNDQHLSSGSLAQIEPQHGDAEVVFLQEYDSISSV